ncbi:WD repeat and HMG-box DNA-binding protein 1 [Cimex lectularius]|uniref:WD repeat-containing protein 55 homolog n=1 Tax=Cimex lectularius TaxID=79782 RepID=A0A8I6RTU2_CIMLE|nr:WD repeat and HMG-box DNA-binding protein 1 [Cimex lectularius]
MPNLRYAHSEGHTDLCYTSDFKYIITCGSEGDVRVWNGVDDVDQKDICAGERAWSLAQKGKNLYVGTEINVVQSYTFPGLETDGIITRFTAPVTQIDVSCDGQKLVAGSCDMMVHVVDLSTLECVRLIGHKAPVLSVCFDPKMEYVVSSGCDGFVKIWSLAINDVIHQWDCLNKTNSFEASKTLCRMHFQKGGTLLAVPLHKSVVLYERGSWNQVQTFGDELFDGYSIVKFSPCGTKLAAGTFQGSLLVWEVTSEKLLKKERDENVQAITGIAWRKDSSGVVFCNSSGQLGDLEIPQSTTMDEDDYDTRAPEDIPISEPIFDDDEDDDENVISLEKIKAQSGFLDNNASPSGKNDDSEDEKESVTSAPAKYHSPISELQQAFQPTSTPTHLQQRFMVWNGVGIIRQFNTDEVNEIDVEFHDTSNNYNVRLNNLLNHTMASLTSNSIVLACARSEDGPSKLMCLVLKSWDGQKEWDCSMPNCEEIVGVSAGEDWVAAAVDNSALRLFSLDGTQIDIFSIPGNFVTMAGHLNKLAVVFHIGIGLNSDQCLSYCELKINQATKLLSAQSIKPLPLSNGTKLRWLGYTDEGSLSSVDSSGVLRILYGSIWRPVCSLDEQCKSKFDHYFVVGINESTHTTRAILCKGAFYPQVIPKPLVSEVKWQIPLCELDSEKGKLEEEYLRNKITIRNINLDNNFFQDTKKSIEKSISITVMKLFALACRSGLEARAVALCEAMQSLDIVKLAAKYAMKMGKHQLAQKVNEVAARMADPVFEIEREEDIRSSYEPADCDQSTEGYSQDLFEETEPVKENLILKLKQKKNDASPKPLRLRMAGNPFRKDNGSSSKNIQNNGYSESKGTFLEWYSENQARLQEENPFMKEGELAVTGMKQYKLLPSNLKEPINSESSQSEPACPKKRKITNQEDDGPRKKTNSLSKLKSFTFQKQSH